MRDKMCSGGRSRQMIKLDDKIKMDLQLFADGKEDGEEGAQAGADGGEDDNHQEGKPEVFDQSEVDRRISKAVESALDKQKRKFDEVKAKEIEEAEKKAQEYSQLTEKEKYEKELEDREKKLKAKEEELRLTALKSDIESDLKENQLPTSLSGVLVKGDNPEAIKEMVTELKVEFDKAVNEAVNDKLAQDVPSGSGKMRTGNKQSKNIRDKARESRLIKN